MRANKQNNKQYKYVKQYIQINNIYIYIYIYVCISFVMSKKYDKVMVFWLR